MSDSNQSALSEMFQSMNSESGGVVSFEHAREAILLEQGDVPEVELPDGSTLALLQVDLNNNMWIIRNRFRPGFSVDTHYHTGPVYAFTESGEWFYKEYPKLVNKAGSYLFEPAQSVHTLTVAEDAKEDAVVSFIIMGSNVNVDEKGNVTSIIDAQTVLRIYRALCEASGKSAAKVIVQE